MSHELVGRLATNELSSGRVTHKDSIPNRNLSPDGDVRGFSILLESLKPAVVIVDMVIFHRHHATVAGVEDDKIRVGTDRNPSFLT